MPRRETSPDALRLQRGLRPLKNKPHWGGICDTYAAFAFGRKPLISSPATARRNGCPQIPTERSEARQPTPTTPPLPAPPRDDPHQEREKPNEAVGGAAATR